jgi:Kef-type K+ transport system membrane component KefB
VSGNGQPPSSRPAGLNKWWISGGYGLMIVATIGIFLLIRTYGQTLTAPAPEGGGQAGSVGVSQSADVFLHVLLALAAVVVTGRVLSKLFTYIGQPPVIGEVVAGICLGPSLLGWIAPGVSAYLLPASVAPSLSVISQLGIILYMFLVGLEMNAGRLQERAHATVATSHASIIAPFLLGAGLALGLYPRLSSSDVPFTSFALFMGIAMSITAFPVLARILTDRRMQRTQLGVISLGCAATDYVTAWCLLAFVVGVAQARVDGAIVVAALTAAYVGFVFLVVRPVARRFVARYEKTRLTQGAMAMVLVALLLSAVATEFIGVHAIFGAFLLGAVIPHDSAIARAITAKLEDLVTVLLLPAFFAFAGMRTQIGLVSGLENWLICGLIILVATAGKFGGSCLAARLTGLNWREAAQLGVLMNTRGLMELIVLNIGLDLKIISPTLFAMMVIMALVTTMGTSPILQILTPRPAAEPSIAIDQDYQPDLAGAGCG